MKKSRLHHPKPSFVPPSSRDSDVSFASSRPSSVGISGRPTPSDLASDRSYHQSAIRSINAYLASHSIPLHIQPNSLPSSKDISLLLNTVLSHLHFPNPNFADDLPPLLKSLNCPFKLSKSSLRTPNTPHAWPHLIPVIHWLVQLSSFLKHSANATSVGGVDEHGNSINAYARESYLRFIRGEDDAEAELDQEFVGKLERERDSLRESVAALEKEAGELESRVEGMCTGVSLKEVKEGERKVLEEDVRKFEAMIGEIRDRMDAAQKVLKEKDEELKVKEGEKTRVDEENNELRKAVNAQTVNARDMERMKRELSALEREIANAEGERNRVEEKCWEMDSVIGQKFKELEEVAMECNKAIRKLKLGLDYQYTLNAKGTSVSEVLGIDYKLTIKPALDSHSDEINKSSVAKLEELISLQQLSKENSSKHEGKRKQIMELQASINELEGQINAAKKEAHDHIQSCTMEAKRMMDNVQMDTDNLNAVEREIAEILATSQKKLEEAIRESEEEIQKCAAELFAVVDSISKHKEYVEGKTAEMRGNVAETARFVSAAYKASLPVGLALELGMDDSLKS
ncbi:hypothetical protein MLD38_038584 [Melastoma candidum]|uniref:Uncharacterized protein n=1 Tax=Melastoma candidum TaxID=119954 RepID=A0ACB9L0K4_9MYRT|nr:hypothetical protein MLD38_038584 [Melastoma candidum]